MAKSPAHQKHPQHKITERRLGERVRVAVGGMKIAESSDVIKLEEDGHPARYYFPRSDVDMQLLHASATTTKCPFKGTANYFDINVGGQRLKDAVWSYEDPYEEHADIKGRLAFYDDRVSDIDISPRA